MPIVKIIAGEPSHDGKAIIGHGTRIFLNGVELQDTTDINLHFGLDEAVRCDVEMLVHSPFEFEAPVDVHLHVTHYYGQEEIKAMCALLLESRREHTDQCNAVVVDEYECTCGANQWNARIDEVLK